MQGIVGKKLRRGTGEWRDLCVRAERDEGVKERRGGKKTGERDSQSGRLKGERDKKRHNVRIFGKGEGEKV